MPTYLFVYRGRPDAMKLASPDRIQHVLQRWMDWVDEGSREGWILDAGDALGAGAVVDQGSSRNTESVVSNQLRIGGYSKVKAHSLERAIEIAKASPVPLEGGSIEIRPFAGRDGLG